MSEPKFLQFKTKDGLTLPGLLYQPKNSKKVVIYLHGNGSSSIFYDQTKGPNLASELGKKNISLFLFNNRGAHIIKKLNVEGKERKNYGMAFEKIKECIEDINEAIKYLEELGFKEFYLAGISTGANKVCVYSYYQPKGKISKYILLNGGDDTGIYYHMLGKSNFFDLLNKSKEKIRKKKGEEIITDPKLFPQDLFSYQAFFDIANPDGDYNVFSFYEVIKKLKLSKKPFRHFKSLKKPTLVIYGELDEYSWGGAENVVNILKDCCPNLDYYLIKGADHGFTGKEEELGKTIVDWL